MRLFLKIFISLFLLAGILVTCKKQPAVAPGSKLNLAPLNPPARTYWPTKVWQTASPETAGLNIENLKKMEAYVFSTSGNEKERKGIRTNGLVIIKDGKLIYERYARGYTAETPHLIWSVSKGFVNAMYGIAVQEGRVKIDYPVKKYITTYKGSQKSKVTLRHLLNMSSGIFWEETYEYAPLTSSVVAMLYTRGRKDMADFVLNQDMRAEPGALVFYSSGDSTLLMGILKKVVSAEEYNDYPWVKLFDKIGMLSAVWEQDATGTFVGSSYIYATPQDMARFGFLYLNDGVWDGERLFPEGWVDFTRTPAPAFQTTTPDEDTLNKRYTAQWYANLAVPGTDFDVPWPDAPADTLAALGHWGQQIYVIPSLDMVIARTGDDRDDSFDKNQFLKLIVECTKK